MTICLHAFTVAEGNVDAHEEIFDSNVEHLCEPVECTRAYAIDACLVFLNLRKTNANGCAQNGLTETFGFADPQEVLADKCIDWMPVPLAQTRVSFMGFVLKKVLSADPAGCGRGQRIVPSDVS